MKINITLRALGVIISLGLLSVTQSVYAGETASNPEPHTLALATRYSRFTGGGEADLPRIPKPELFRSTYLGGGNGYNAYSKMLIRSGASVHIKNSEGKSPMQIILEKNNYELIHYLKKSSLSKTEEDQN